MKSRRGITDPERRRREAQQAESELIKGVNSKAQEELLQASAALISGSAQGYTYAPFANGIWSTAYSNYLLGGTGTWVSPNNPAVSPSSPNLVASPSSFQWNGIASVPFSFQVQLQSPNPSPPKRLPSRRFHMPVVGYRSWQVEFVGKKAILGSTGVSCKWSGTRLDARCTGNFYTLEANTRNKHRSPHERCTCGIYVYKRAENIGLGNGDLWGAVMTWGKHVEHGQEGYRAAHARVIAFVEPSRAVIDFKNWVIRKALAEEAAQRFGLPLVRHEEIAKYAAEFGQEFKD